MSHQLFETSSLTGRSFSRAATSDFVSDKIGRVVLMDDIVNSLVGDIFSRNVINGHDSLSARDRTVMLNSTFREMFSIRASQSYQKGDRKGEYP